MEKILQPNGIVFEHYFLMVPQYHAAELVAHAAKRSGVVRAFGLSFIGPEFMIHIKTPDDYPAELRGALIDGGAQALLPDPVTGAEDVRLFESSKPGLVERLDTKLLSVGSGPDDRQELRDALIRRFLEKEQLLQALREWPDTWESVERRRLLRQDALELENVLSADGPSRRVLNLIAEYQNELLANVSALRGPDAQRIAWGQVGEWLMNCPLKFKSAS